LFSSCQLHNDTWWFLPSKLNYQFLENKNTATNCVARSLIEGQKTKKFVFSKLKFHQNAGHIGVYEKPTRSLQLATYFSSKWEGEGPGAKLCFAYEYYGFNPCSSCNHLLQEFNVFHGFTKTWGLLKMPRLQLFLSTVSFANRCKDPGKFLLDHMCRYLHEQLYEPGVFTHSSVWLMHGKVAALHSSSSSQRNWLLGDVDGLHKKWIGWLSQPGEERRTNSGQSQLSEKLKYWRVETRFYIKITLKMLQSPPYPWVCIF